MIDVLSQNNVPQVTVPQVTSLEQLLSYQNGEVIELPPFSIGQPFIARLRRPSLLKMVKDGKIPNSLLVSANQLFSKGANGFDEKNQNMMKEMFEILDLICEASFVEPSFSKMKEAGITLTDEQYMFVFSYAQGGVKDLESFRK